MTIFKGAGVALVTPFSNGKVDFDRYGALIDWQLEQGIDALISCGTTGEASTLTEEEHIEVVRFAVERANGKVPVIGGSGSNNTAHAVAMSKALEKVGVDGLLIVTPYYNKCTQKGLIEHYTAIADEIKTPMILYSVPGRTGVTISPFAVSVLAKHPNIVGLKDANGDISKSVEMARYIDDHFALYSGNDDMTIPIMSLGGLGVISTAANVIPKDMHGMTMAYFDGNTKKAAEMQIQAKALIDALFTEVNPIPVKAALEIMGRTECEYRLPMCPPSPETYEKVRKELLEYGIISK